MNKLQKAVANIFNLRYAPDYDGYYVDSNPALLNSIMPSSSGIVVNEDVAMTYSAYYACVKVISETIATLPLHIYRRLDDDGKERAQRHPLYFVLHDEPNPEMTSFQFRETMMQHLLTWGNSYSSIVRSAPTKIDQLWPLRPDRMKVQTDDKGRRQYIYQLPGGEKRVLNPLDVLHIMGGSSTGLTGQSPVGQMRDAIALGISTEDFGNEFYKNGLALSGVFIHPNKLSDPAKKNITESINKYKTGLGNRHRWMVMQEGMDFKQIGVPPENAQFLETRKFQLEEMCRIHRLQLHKVQHLEHATFSNIEHQAIEFTVDTVQPWSKRIESELKRQLFSDGDKQNYFIEFLLDGLLRGDIKTRYEAHSIGIQNGWMTINDARKMERMNPSEQEGADKLYKQNIWTEVGAAAPTLPDPITPTVEPPKAEEKSASPIIEVRSVGIGDRNKLRAQYEPLFRDSAMRIVRIEVNELRGAIKKYFPKRGVNEFETWVDGFYDKFSEKIEKNFKPLVQSYGTAIAGVASREAGGDGVIQSELDAFVEGYVEVSGKRHVGSSRGQIKKIIREADAEELEDALMLRLGEWDDRRADKIAGRESVEASDAFAKMAWVLAGVTRYMWVAQGAKPCPFCEELSGTVVGIEQSFVPEGGSVTPEGEEPMVVRGAKMHAPLHAGCVCSVVPA